MSLSEESKAASALRHTSARLKKAQEALNRLQNAGSLDAQESAWTDVLLFGNAVYSKLEQGSKVSRPAQGWFGRAKSVRKRDPLLSYMHHARNSDEHGIEDLTRRMKAGQATVTIREPFDPAKLDGVVLRINHSSQPGHVLVSSSNEDVVSTTTYDTPALQLLRVTSLYGDYFDPPYEHLGRKIENQFPLTVARLFVEYLTTLVDDARSILL